MAKDKKKSELWVVKGGKPPKKVGSMEEGLKEVGKRDWDAEVHRVRDETGKGTKRTAKQDKPKKDK